MTDTTNGPIGLVLSGGGARGLAHVGVIRYLEELGIRPTLVAGTSAGALVGALYAAGVDVDTMLDFFIRTKVFSGRSYAFGKPGLIDLEKCIPPFRELVPEDSFEALKYELQVVATDLEKGERVVFHKGELIRPLLASAAVPFVFAPVRIGGVLYCDGGITDNFPVDLIAPRSSQLIGVYVNHIAPIGPKSLKNSLDVLQRAYHIGVDSTVRASFAECSVLIAPALSRFSTFDMQHLQEIHDVGHAAARASKAALMELKKKSRSVADLQPRV